MTSQVICHALKTPNKGIESKEQAFLAKHAQRGIRMLRFNADTAAEAQTLKSVMENGPESHFERATAIEQSRKEIVAIRADGADVHINVASRRHQEASTLSVILTVTPLDFAEHFA